MSDAWLPNEPYGVQRKKNRNIPYDGYVRKKKKKKKNPKHAFTGIKRKLWNQRPYCYYCNCKLAIHEATVDHVVPLSRGGAPGIENCVLACEPCNNKKGNNLFEPRFKK